MTQQQKPRFGVNYVPSKNWWYSWLDWDDASIADDLQAIASLGMDHVRIHCIWPVFQPNFTYVSETALSRLARLMDLADAAGLDVNISVLDGWLSGFSFFPAWRGKLNIFTDEKVIAAEELLFRKIAERIADHPRFMGFDLGNEIGVLIGRDNPITLGEGDAWNKRMLDLCEQLAPGKSHVNGVDHCQWFHTFGFSRNALANTGDLTVLHTYIFFTGASELYGPMDTGCLHLAEYMIELTKAYANDLNHQAWVQEFGASHEWVPLDRIPDFAEKFIRNAASCSGLWGFTWWGSHDIRREFTGFSNLEYDLGLLDVNNNVKPAGKRISQLIEEFKTKPPQTIDRPVAFVLPDDLLAKPSGDLPAGWQFAKPYMDLIDQGVRPAVVLESRSTDAAYLASRGITELRRLAE